MSVSLNVLVNSEKGVRFSGVEVTGGCELPDMLGNELRPSTGRVNSKSKRSYFSSLHSI